MRYRADIAAGALKLPESRIVARLLLDGVCGSDWNHAVETENVLQARNPATAVRLARLVRQRLGTMDAGLWRLVRDGTGVVAAHAVLAASVKHSPLLGDFFDLVLRERYRTFKPTLTWTAWDDYLHACRGRDPDMPCWEDSTRRRLRSSVYQMLAQAGYLADTRSLVLQPVHISRQVLDYLKEHEEEYVLRCIEVSP